MEKRKWSVIIFAIAVILALAGYSYFLKWRAPDSGSPALPPPQLSPEEKEKILSTLKAKNKEQLTPQQKAKILNSLTAP